MVAITNHRNELIVVDLETGESHLVDKSDYKRITGSAWSPDGSWLAYSFAFTAQKRAIKVCNMETGETHFVTDPVLKDVSPSFDPQGKYLYFLGYRTFNPVYDKLHFDLSFPRGVKPYAIMLRRDQRSPFMPEPKVPGGKEKEKENGAKKPEKENGMEGDEQEEDTASKKSALVIDLEGITT